MTSLEGDLFLIVPVLFRKTFALLSQSSFGWSVSWFFGPLLLRTFVRFLCYYDLC